MGDVMAAKPESKQQNKETAPTSGPSEKAPASVPTQKAAGAGLKVGCNATGCKQKDVRFSFCEEHFRQFKFGLITKSGAPAFDFEKKFEHYQRFLKAQKVA